MQQYQKVITLIDFCLLFVLGVGVGAAGMYWYFSEANAGITEVKDIHERIEEEQSSDQAKGALSEIAEHGDFEYRIIKPKYASVVSSPLTIVGEISGGWYWEGSFRITLEDHDGVILSETVATATEAWTEEGLVPFTAVLMFDSDSRVSGTIVLIKENPSGLPENDDFIKIPVLFSQD